VQLPSLTGADSAGGSLSAQVLDGVRYGLDVCTGDARIVINLSCGSFASPHDGSSLIEQAPDELLRLVVPPGDFTDTFVEVWFDKGQPLDLLRAPACSGDDDGLLAITGRPVFEEDAQQPNVRPDRRQRGRASTNRRRRPRSACPPDERARFKRRSR